MVEILRSSANAGTQRAIDTMRVGRIVTPAIRFFGLTIPSEGQINQYVQLADTCGTLTHVPTEGTIELRWRDEQ